MKEKKSSIPSKNIYLLNWIFFIILFTGLRVKYYINELDNLDLDFYYTEKL